MPVLHLIAGPHGAGKSTFYQSVIAPRYPAIPFVDSRPREEADVRRQQLLHAGHSFATETAFSHPSRVALLAQARTLGFDVVLYAIALDEPRQLLERLRQRAREGGPCVASHTVIERYARCLDNLRQAVFMADLALLIDATHSTADGPRLIATLVRGQMHLNAVLRPRWAEKVLGFAEA
jgi:predicted ABC-type ATPase